MTDANQSGRGAWRAPAGRGLAGAFAAEHDPGEVVDLAVESDFLRSDLFGPNERGDGGGVVALKDVPVRDVDKELATAFDKACGQAVGVDLAIALR